MQPLNEDKFLCYSCNNWLINWYWTQNTSGSSSSTANRTDKLKANIAKNSIPEESCSGSSSSSHGYDTSSSSSTNNSEGDSCSSSINDTLTNMTECINMDANNQQKLSTKALELRHRLRKYLYKPAEIFPTFINQHQTIAKSQKPIVAGRLWKCNLCSTKISRKMHQNTMLTIPIRRNNRVQRKCLQFCRKCKQTLIKYVCANVPLSKKQQKQHQTDAILTKITSQQLKTTKEKLFVNPYALSRLKKLGTTVVREDRIALNKLKQYHHQQHHHNQNNSKHQHYHHHHQFIQPPSPPLPFSRNENNEIVLSFNQTLTEIFPSNNSMLTNNAVVDEDGKSMSIKKTTNLSEIYKRIPNSLSITLVAVD